MKYLSLILAAVVVYRIAPSARTQEVLFSEDFDTDSTAEWSFNSTEGDAADDAVNQEANFFFDYSTAGIPPAPGGTLSTRGLKMEANIPDGTPLFNGLSVSPLNQSFL